VDEALVTELESAIADTGALVVRIQRYRRGLDAEGAALLAGALALGDAARRLHRRGRLAAAEVEHLLAEARGLAGRMRGLLAAVQAAPEYAAAVAAHAAGDQTTLARLLPAIFAGLDRATRAIPLYAPVAWRRRGRPRPAAEVAGEVVRLRDEGLEAEGDDLSPGADPALPAVVLRAEAPEDEPVLLRFAPGAVALPVFRLADTGERLVYTPRLRAAFTVVRLPADELEASPVDWERHRGEIVQALAAARCTIETG
jgi:hypothetical protein